MPKSNDTPRYTFQIHSWVSFVPENGFETGSFEGPCSIVHHTGDRVWVHATSYDFPVQNGNDVVMVTDGKSSGYDREGGCIASVSTKHVRAYHDDEEAQSIFNMMDADERLLSYARSGW